MRRVPWLMVVAAALVALLAALATLQYRWLGDVSQAERERMRAGLQTRASDFSEAFDRELSLLAVRGRNGTTAYYPLIENEHQEGILVRSRAPAPSVDAELQVSGVDDVQEDARVAPVVDRGVGHEGSQPGQ